MTHPSRAGLVTSSRVLPPPGVFAFGLGVAVLDAGVAADMGVAAVTHREVRTQRAAGWLTTAAVPVMAAAAVVRAAHRGLRRRGEQGLATVEFVILIPVLLAVVGLAVIAGRITTAQGEVQGAVRAAARAASLQRDPADARAAADQAAQSDLQAAGVTCGGYTLQVAVGPPGGVDQATLSCVVPLGGVEWMNVAPSKTIVVSFSAPVDKYRAGT